MAQQNNNQDINRTDRTTSIPRSILNRQGWPEALIEDYDEIAQQDFRPLCGAMFPDNNVTATQSQFYVRMEEGQNELYFNPNAGADTGWIQLI